MYLPDPLNPEDFKFEPRQDKVEIEVTKIYVSSKGDITELGGILKYYNGDGEIIDEREVKLEKGYLSTR